MADTFHTCQTCFEAFGSIFKNFPLEGKDILESSHTCRLIKKGELIYHEGDKPSGLICLAKGKVKIFMEGISGREQIIHLAKPIGFIGYRAFIADEHHHSSAMALEDSVVCLFTRNEVLLTVKKYPELMLKIVKLMANELGVAQSRTISLTQKHIRGRLAESLLLLLNTYGLEDDGKTIKAYLCRDDLASLSNMTASNAIRTLTQFSEEGIISTEGRKLKILNQYKLGHISEIG